MCAIFKNLSLLETKSKSFSLKVRCNDGTEKIFHSLYDPVGEAKAIVDAFRFDGRGILVILGLGLGYHVIELIKRFPDAEIIVLEAVPEIYKLAKDNGYISEFEDRIKFIVGLPTNKALEEITRFQIKEGMPPITIFILSTAISAFPDYYQPILKRLKNVVSLKLCDRLGYSKFKYDKLRIAIMDFGYFLNLEIEKSIKVLGHNVLRVKGWKGEQPSDILVRLIKMIINFKPDFILTINHLGFDENGALTSFFKSIKMPVASWFVDNPELIIKAHNKNVSPYTSLFLWDRTYINDVRTYGFEDIHYLPLATDEDIFMPIDPRDNRLEPFICEVGFVGNSMVIPAQKYISRVEGSIKPLINRLAEKIAYSNGSLQTIIKELPEKEKTMIEGLSPKERMDFEAAILWKATLMYRSSCIQMLKGFDVRIYGDKGWKGLLNGGFKIHSALNYYEELPLLYNACKVNFNATSLQMPEAVNQRVFDVPACGAFILTDYQKALEELFKIGEEIIAYRNKEEIPELVRFYLDNPEVRSQISIRGRERILKEHTYKQRLNKIIEIMKSRYK